MELMWKIRRSLRCCDGSFKCLIRLIYGILQMQVYHGSKIDLPGAMLGQMM
jgi:hypothetical protein